MERFFNHIVCGFYFLDKYLLGSENRAIRRIMGVFSSLQLGTTFYLLGFTIGFKRMLSWGAEIFVSVLLIIMVIELFMAIRYSEKHIDIKFKDYYAEFSQYFYYEEIKVVLFLLSVFNNLISLWFLWFFNFLGNVIYTSNLCCYIILCIEALQ